MQPVAIAITPRFYETDAQGHINNATIAAWFEVSRVRFLETLEDGEPDTARHWMLASVQIDFLAETFYGSDVTAQIVSAEAGNTSLKLHAEMYQDGRQTIRGIAVLVFVGEQGRTPIRVPDNYREKITAG